MKWGVDTVFARGDQPMKPQMIAHEFGKRLRDNAIESG